MKARWPLAGVLGLASVGLVAGSVSATTPAPGVSTKILVKSTLTPVDINSHSLSEPPWSARIRTRGTTDAYVVDNTFAPGSDTGWHSHPGPSMVFVVAGTVTNYSSDSPACQPQVYAAGSNFVDPGGKDSHLLRNEGTVPAETIAVQLLPSGSTRRIDEPIPDECAR